MKQTARQLDIYSELCPALSATVIGAGLITITIGSVPAGALFVLAGIAAGAAGPMVKTFQERKTRGK